MTSSGCPLPVGTVVTYVGPRGQHHKATIVRYVDPGVWPAELELSDGIGTRVRAPYSEGTERETWHVNGPLGAPMQVQAGLRVDGEVRNAHAAPGQLTVACVLRSGGDFNVHWVRALMRQVEHWLPDAKFVCLSDCRVPCERVPLIHDWPGWWSKMELWRPGLFNGPVLYFDLDTLIVGDISEIAARRGGLLTTSNMNAPELAQTGMMMWTPGAQTDALYAEFCRNPADFIDGSHGMFVHERVATDRFRLLWPGKVVSLKIHAREKVPDGAAVVMGHGDPRLDRPEAGWAHTEWLRWAIGGPIPDSPSPLPRNVVPV